MLLDKKEVDKGNRAVSKTRLAVLRTDRSILLVAVFALALINLYAVFLAASAVNASMRTHEVVWVKMFRDGSSAIDAFTPDDEQPVYVRAVNAGLARYITARFQTHPETIKRDYAEAGVFLGDALFTQFTDKSAFDAAGKAMAIAAKPDEQPRTDITDIRTDHYDQIDGDFSGTRKPVIRTTLMWNEIMLNRAGKISGEKTPHVLRITWTLLSRDEVSQKSVDWLRINPLGIVILTQEELDR